MNLCLYTATFLPSIGGAELVLHALASALAVQGHSVTVLAPLVRRADNRVEAPYRLRRYQRPSSKRFGVRQILLYLLHEYWRRPFDVLHCHGAYPPAYVGATLKRLLNIPMVVRPHGSDILPGEFIRANVKLEQRLTRALAAADLIIAQSQFLKREMLSLGVPDGRIRLIPNGVHVAEFQPVRSASPLPYPFILAMGSFSLKKGFDVLLRAFTSVAAEDPSIHLVLAGAGKELTAYTALVGEQNMLGRVHFVGIVEGVVKIQLYQHCLFFVCPSRREPFATVNLEALAAGQPIVATAYTALVGEQNMLGRVHFVGIVEGVVKIQLYQHCLFFVCPSRREPFATVNLEALAAGQPIVATAVGGNLEVVSEGGNGFLVPPDDPDALATCMLTLLKDPALRATMGRLSLDFARRYDWQVILPLFRAAFEDALAWHRDQRR